MRTQEKFKDRVNVFPWVFLMLLSGTTCYGQGQVRFSNTATTLITTNSVPGGAASGPISGPMGSYYFALLMAPAGTMDTRLFVFTGAYGINTVQDGRFNGGIPYVDAPIGSSRSFLVLGWSANIGSDYSSLINYLSNPTFTAWYGQSQIATAIVGEDTYPLPPVLFGTGEGKIPGFNLDMVPEPSALVLVSLGVGVWLVSRHQVQLRRRRSA